MLFILMVHYTGAAFGLPSCEELQATPTTGMLLRTLFESISIIGVDCFVLISGYYGIRATRKGLTNYVLWCLSASLLVWAAECVWRGQFLGNGLWTAVRVFSATDLWFVPAYLALYLLSPVLNGGWTALTRHRRYLFLAGLVFLNVYLGWWCGGRMNPFGYNVMQLVFVYFIGRLLADEKAVLSRIRSCGWLLLYFLFTACIFGSAFVFNSRMAYAYNAPAVLLSAVSFFMFFACMPERHIPWVNWVASSAFMVYLLHKSPGVWKLQRDCLLDMRSNLSGMQFVLGCIALALAVFVASVLIDKVRIALTNVSCRLLSKLRD